MRSKVWPIWTITIETFCWSKSIKGSHSPNTDPVISCILSVEHTLMLKTTISNENCILRSQMRRTFSKFHFPIQKKNTTNRMPLNGFEHVASHLMLKKIIRMFHSLTFFTFTLRRWTNVLSIIIRSTRMLWNCINLHNVC